MHYCASCHGLDARGNGPAAFVLKTTPPDLTALAKRHGEISHALPKQSFYSVHAEPKLFFEPSDFAKLISDSEVIGLHISPKGRGNQAPQAGSLYAWATQRFA